VIEPAQVLQEAQATIVYQHPIMNRITSTDRNAPIYTYSLGSLNGCVCYRQVVMSMIYWLNSQHEGYAELTNIETIVNKAESWTSMRMQYLSTTMNPAPDGRVFDSDQIHQLQKADNYDDAFNLLMSFRDSYRLSFQIQ
jgi:hypothetical protein